MRLSMATDMVHVRLCGSELVVLVVVAILVAVIGVIGFSFGVNGADGPSTLSSEYAMGEWVDLDNQGIAEEAGKGSADRRSYGLDYRPLGEWDGTLRFRVDEVTLFDSPEAAGIPVDDIQLPSYLPTWKQDGHSLCLLTYTVENVDASSVPGSTKSGRQGFRTSFLESLEGIEAFDQIYFDGMIEDGSLEDGDGNVFRLKPGETRTFHSGIVVAGDGVPFALRIGDPNCGIRVALECEDKRSHS